jgi:hypothetical protein
VKNFNFRAFLLSLLVLLCSPSSFAQSDSKSSGALSAFLDKAAAHIAISNEVKKQCPNAKFELDFQSQFKSGLESSPLLLLLLDSKIEHSATDAELKTTPLVEKFGGCSSPNFERLEKSMSIFGGKLLAQWIAQDF